MTAGQTSTPTATTTTPAQLVVAGLGPWERRFDPRNGDLVAVRARRVPDATPSTIPDVPNAWPISGPAGGRNEAGSIGWWSAPVVLATPGPRRHPRLQALGPFDHAGNVQARTPALRADALATADREASHPSVLAWNLANEVSGQGNIGVTDSGTTEDKAATVVHVNQDPLTQGGQPIKPGPPVCHVAQSP